MLLNVGVIALIFLLYLSGDKAEKIITEKGTNSLIRGLIYLLALESLYAWIEMQSYKCRSSLALSLRRKCLPRSEIEGALSDWAILLLRVPPYFLGLVPHQLAPSHVSSFFPTPLHKHTHTPPHTHTHTHTLPLSPNIFYSCFGQSVHFDWMLYPTLFNWPNFYL